MTATAESHPFTTPSDPSSTSKPDGLRQDAVSYRLQALQLFEGMELSHPSGLTAFLRRWLATFSALPPALGGNHRARPSLRNHLVDAIAQIQTQHQARPGQARLPEVVPQDQPADLPRQTAAIQVVGHQHAPLQQGCQGWRHRAPLLLALPVRREQQQGDLHEAAEPAGAGGLQIHHREAPGTSGQQLRQGRELVEGGIAVIRSPRHTCTARGNRF